jgi:hypothetical protein
MTDDAQDRRNAVRLQFKKFELETSDPKWSSYALDRFLEKVMSAPGGSIQDVYQELDRVLETYSVELTKSVAAFIKDLVILGFTRHRQSYGSVNWKEVVEGLGRKPTQAQLYFALHAIPPRFVTPSLGDAIARGLESTAFRDEAVSMLTV